MRYISHIPWFKMKEFIRKERGFAGFANFESFSKMVVVVVI